MFMFGGNVVGGKIGEVEVEEVFVGERRVG